MCFGIECGYNKRLPTQSHIDSRCFHVHSIAFIPFVESNRKTKKFRFNDILSGFLSPPVFPNRFQTFHVIYIFRKLFLMLFRFRDDEVSTFDRESKFTMQTTQTYCRPDCLLLLARFLVSLLSVVLYGAFENQADRNIKNETSIQTQPIHIKIRGE